MSTQDILRVYWDHAKRYPWTVLASVLLVIIGTVSEVIQPWFYKELFDIFGSQPFTVVTFAVFAPAVLSIIITKIVGFVASRVLGFMTAKFQPKVMADLTQTAFDHLLGHSYQYYSDHFAGSLVRTVLRFATGFERLADELTFNLVPTFGVLMVVMAGFYPLYPSFALIFTVWVVLFFAINYRMTLWAMKRDEARANLDSHVSGILSDAVANALTIKLFASSAKEKAYYREAALQFAQAQTRSWFGHDYVYVFQGVSMLAVEIWFLVYGVDQWLVGVFTLGDFAFIQSNLMLIFSKLWSISRSFRKGSDAIADGRAAVEMLQTPYEVADRRKAKPLVVSAGEIVFEQVDFSFHKTRRVLDKFSLTIQPQEKVAFVGSSGAGKSTITKLLLRFYDIDGGHISIDGQDIAKVTQDSLHEAIAFVPQDPILFHRTIGENILYGRPSATKDEMIAAAKKAHCHEFIDALPLGYDTYVGERGIKLSGGERQRITIARAILKNAPILVLDEATSSLDSESELLIQQALSELMQQKTVIVIAHRLSTIMMMDRIVVIENGKIVSSGSHAQLLRKQGTYKRLWNIQAGAFE